MFVHLSAYIHLITFVSLLREVVAYITVLDQGLYPLEHGSIGIQFFIDVENNHHLNLCKVSSWPKMCCLADEEYKDCSVDAIHGDNDELIKPKNRQTLVYVYPTLYQYDQVGSCDFVISYRCGNTRRSRLININIPFDTQFANKKKMPYLKAYTEIKGSDCESLDEDSLRECEAVNCDLKYSGRRPYYESSRGKCVSAPVCETNLAKDLPDIVYVPNGNICRDLDDPITNGDIYAINTGLGIVTDAPKPSFKDLKVLLKSNCSTISQNMILLKDLMFGKLCPMLNSDTSDYKKCCLNALLSIVGYIIATCGLVLSGVCCLHTTMWCYAKWSKGELKDSIITWMPTISKAQLSIHRPSKISRNVTNNLLREVIVRDLPIDMRDSMVDLCARIDHEIKHKKRYRVVDLGSQINLIQSKSPPTSESSSQTSLVDYDDRTNR